LRVSTTTEFHANIFDCGPQFPFGVVAGSAFDIDVFGIANHCPIARPVIQTGRLGNGGGGATAVVMLAMLEKALRFAAASVARTR